VNPALRQWNKTGQLPGLKFMRTLWVSQASGGPFTYPGKDLGAAHKDLHITSAEFDEVGAEIGRACDHFKVPEREKNELLAGIVARKGEVVRSWTGQRPRRSAPLLRNCRSHE
jgi:hemoglobin